MVCYQQGLPRLLLIFLYYVKRLNFLRYILNENTSAMVRQVCNAQIFFNKNCDFFSFCPKGYKGASNTFYRRALTKISLWVMVYIQ